MRWRDISSRPKWLIRPTWMRARSLFRRSLSRRSTERLFHLADGDNGSSLIVFLLDRKQVQRFKAGELTKERLQSTVKGIEEFLAGKQ